MFKNFPTNQLLKIWRKWWDKILFMLIMGFIFLLSPGQNIYTSLFSTLSEKKMPKDIPQYVPHPYPVNKTGNQIGADITASGIVILDADSGTFLYKRNENFKLAPASTTKLLTALVVLDKYKLDDVINVKIASVDGQLMGLVPDEKITVENLLYGLLIQSGNDAGYALAESYPGKVEGFVKAMNQKAKELNLTGSNFTNPVGYDNPDHKMTPLDLARLSTQALNNKTIAKMVAIPAITISDVTYTNFHSLKNVNQLLGKIPGVGGIKTGWTEEAGENLVTFVERYGHRVVLVVLRSEDRFGETAKLIEWVFSNFKWEEISGVSK